MVSSNDDLSDYKVVVAPKLLSSPVGNRRKPAEICEKRRSASSHLFYRICG